MKKAFIFLAFGLILLIFFLTLSKKTKINHLYWDSKWFTMEIPDDFDVRKWTPNMSNKALNFRLIRNVELFKDVKFTPKEEKWSGTLEVQTFNEKNGRKLDYKDFMNFFRINGEEEFHNDLLMMRSDTVHRIQFEGELKSFYSTNWLVQGENRVYYIRYGSYNKERYDEYLDAVIQSVKTFKEK